MNHRAIVLLTFLLSALIAESTALAGEDWTQWGGPERDFMIHATGLADQWPADGPKELWRRELGDGYATIVTDGKTLYTGYSNKDGQECIIALSADTGETVWEYKYPRPFLSAKVKDPETGEEKDEPQVQEFGTGVNSTPLLHDGRLYTVGFTSKMFCLDATTGEPLWFRDLFKGMGGTYLRFGYAASPIAYKNWVIVPVGGKGQGLVAFDKDTGEIGWKGTDFDASYSSPIIVKVDGMDHLVVYMTGSVVGISPEDGTVHWSLEHRNRFGTSIMTPVWCPGDRLFFSNGGEEAGSRMVRLKRDGDKIKPEEVWWNKKLTTGMGNPVLVEGTFYGGGSRQAPILIGFDLESGEIKWRQRGFSQPNMVAVGDKLVVLDSEGKLMLCTPKDDGVDVKGEAQMLEKEAWSAPTVVGTRVYMRDKKTIMAVDLARAQAVSLGRTVSEN